MNLIFRLAWRNLGRNPARTGVFMGAAVLGFAMALFTLNTMKAISTQRLSDAIDIQTSDLQLHRRGFLDDREITATLPQAEGLAQRFRQVPGVVGVAPRLVFNAVVAAPENNIVGEIRGIVPAEENRISALGTFLTEGQLLADSLSIPLLVSRKTADKLKLRLKSKVVVTLKTATGELSGGLFRVVGIFATPSTPFDESTVLARYDDLAKLAGVSAPHEFAIKLAAPSLLDQVKAQIAPTLPPTVVLNDWKELLPELFAFDGYINMIGVLLTVIICLGLGFSLLNTMNMIVQERTRELGMLRAVGQSRRSVFGMLLIEAVLMMVLGSLVGVVLGAGLVALAGQTGVPISEGLGSLGIRPVIYPVLNPALLGVVLGLALLLTIILAVLPASRIFRLPISNALTA